MGLLKITAIITFCLLLLIGSAFAGGFENTNVGLRATAMGGAFRALSDDWSAALYNPAGYALILDNQAGGNASFLHYRNEIVPNYRRNSNTDAFETGFYNDRSIYNTHEILSNPSAGILFRLPVAGETVFGFSIYQPFDYNISWNLFSPLLAYGDNLSLPNNQYQTNLDVVAFQLSAGREFNEEQIYLGLGVQILRADLIFSEIKFRDNPMPSPYNDRPYELIPEWANVDGNGWGLGFRGGMLWKATDRITMGFTAHLPLDITIKGDNANLNFYLPEVGDTVGGYTVGSIENLFSSGAQINVRSSFETKLKMPPSAGIGLAFDITDRFKVAIDAQYMLWSQFEGFEFVYSNFSQITRLVDTSIIVDGTDTTDVSDWATENTSHVVDWKNAGRVMMGAEFRATNLYTIYAGGFADQSPARTTTQFTPNFIDTGDKFGFSAGVMFHINEWDFGLASSFTTYPDLTIPDIDSDGDGIDDSVPGFYKANQYETVLSFIYRF